MPATTTSSSNKPIQVTSSSFENEVVNAGLPVIVDFWAPWCGPCRAIGPVLDKLASRFAGRVKVAKVNVDAEPQLAAAFNVRSIPTIVAMNGRTVIDVRVGFGGPADLERLFSQALSHSAQAEGAAP